MGDVISLVKPPKDGEKAFLHCPCGESFHIVVVVGDCPVISGLVCEECDTHMTVENGVVTA